MIRSLRPGESPPPTEPKRYPNSSGYIRLRWRVGPGEYVEAYEHRVIAGEPVGQVHHRDHDKTNNDPSNLEVLTPADHARLHHMRHDADEMVRLYADGMSTPQVAAVLGCDAATVYRALVRNGVKPRSLSESQRVEVDDERLTAMHEAGARSTAIAAKLGVSRGKVQTRVHELGLTPHPCGRPSQ